jgi:ribosome-associated translation inhibitor RaiA
MEIAVRTRHILPNQNLQAHVARKVENAVNRLKDRIDRISVLLSDVNGPRGGADKLCQMTAYVRGIGTVLITAVGSDLFGAVANAAERLGYRIHSKVRRRREFGAHRRATIRAVEA